jgi:hypothetical protein
MMKAEKEVQEVFACVEKQARLDSGPSQGLRRGSDAYCLVFGMSFPLLSKEMSCLCGLHHTLELEHPHIFELA